MIESEKVLEKLLSSKVKKLKGLSIKILPFINAGLPDRLCLLPEGYIFFAEIKTTGEKLKPLQELFRKKIISLGFRYYVVDNSEMIKLIIKDYETFTELLKIRQKYGRNNKL